MATFSNYLAKVFLTGATWFLFIILTWGMFSSW